MEVQRSLAGACSARGPAVLCSVEKSKWHATDTCSAGGRLGCWRPARGVPRGYASILFREAAEERHKHRNNAPVSSRGSFRDCGHTVGLVVACDLLFRGHVHGQLRCWLWGKGIGPHMQHRSQFFCALLVLYPCVAARTPRAAVSLQGQQQRTGVSVASKV